MTNHAQRRSIMLIPAIALLCATALAQTHTMNLRVSAGESAASNVPVHASMPLPGQFTGLPLESIAVTLYESGASGALIPGQLVQGADGQVELWWIVPRTQPGQTSDWTATLSAGQVLQQQAFSWSPRSNDVLDLLCDGRPVLRCMHAYDPSTPDRLFETYKPYYHVFDASGQHLLTNGPGGLYPHHRGIFVGWNKTKIGDQEYDFWHMKGVTQQHQRIVSQTAGPVLARSKALIHWVGPDGKPVIAEQREVTVFRQPAPTIVLLDFHTELKAVAGDVFLGGDPEHAGVHYRAHNDVADGGPDVKATYLFHADGIDALKDENLPWAAMSYGLNGRRYSVQHMNHPDNPKPSKYSAYRDYGRFGAFFTKQLKAGEVLPLRYRILIVEATMPPRENLADNYSAFAAPPQATVMKGKP
jgi:hypothetical protein